MLRALLSASLTLQPHQLPDAVHCVSPDCWTGSAGTRLAADMRWAAETDATFFPKKTAEWNNLIKAWKETSGKDSDCRSCNLSTFFMLFPSPCNLFKSAWDNSRSSLELGFPWLGKDRWPACSRINQNIGKKLVNTGGSIQECAYVCIYGGKNT